MGPTEEYYENVKKLAKRLTAKEDTIRFATRLADSGNLPEEEKADFMQCIENEVPFEALEKQIEGLLVSYFDEEEIALLENFYCSTVGRRVSKKYLEFSRDLDDVCMGIIFGMIERELKGVKLQ